MAVIIRGNHLGIAGQMQNSGVFIGQNIQTGWDSISVDKIASGFNMGDFSLNTSVMSYYLGTALNWQSIHDNDFKGNGEIRFMR